LVWLRPALGPPGASPQHAARIRVRGDAGLGATWTPGRVRAGGEVRLRHLRCEDGGEVSVWCEARMGGREDPKACGRRVGVEWHGRPRQDRRWVRRRNALPGRRPFAYHGAAPQRGGRV